LFVSVSNVSLHKIIFKFRIPRAADLGPAQFLENLLSVTCEESLVHAQFVSHIRAHSPLRNLTLRGSTLESAFIHHLQPPPYPRNTREFLKVLDLSDVFADVRLLLEEWVLDDLECQVTHLYLENCPLNNRPPPEHLQLEFLSIAGERPYSGDWLADWLHDWAAIPTMRKINASGCDLTEMMRDDLITTHGKVEFDLDEMFHRSPRIQM
jgi:hypothetical protein